MQAEFIKMPQMSGDDGVNEYIIENEASKKGACRTCCVSAKNPDGFVCPPCCYRQTCVMMNGVFLCFAVVICLGVLIGLSVTSGKPHLKTLQFVEGTCTTVRSNYTGTEETCSCGGRFCHASYPCLEVVVNYRTKDGNEIESILHEDEHVYTYKPHCSYQPESCIQSQNSWYVSYYKDKWGLPGLEFPCHHHPSQTGAIRRRTRTLTYAIHMLLWPSVCSAVAILLCVIVYCHCCPRCYNE